MKSNEKTENLYMELKVYLWGHYFQYHNMYCDVQHILVSQ